MGAPDYMAPLVGWRCWLVGEVCGAPRLVSVVYHVVWQPRQELTAECLRWRPQLLRPWRRRPPDHDPPRECCKCGVYAADTLQRALFYLDRDGYGTEPLRYRVLCRVLGRVALWGSVVECEHGWRGLYAYPERLFVPASDRAGEPVAGVEETARALSAYRVPVELVDEAENVASAVRSAASPGPA